MDRQTANNALGLVILAKNSMVFVAQEYFAVCTHHNFRPASWRRTTHDAIANNYR